MKSSLAVSILVLGSIFGMAQAVAQERSSAPTVLVIDASNSMWGRIDGQPKMAIARDAVTALVEALPKGTRLGVVAYGHRRSGDCEDIEVALPVGPVDSSKVQAVAGRLTPRGKTPITASLKEAANLLEAGKPGSIIILTDGVETCKGDPCALAEELKRKNAGLVAHVIGFDVSAVERPKLACIAERTGGTFLAAANAGELGEALKATTKAKPKPAVRTRSIALEATEAGRPVPQALFTIARSGETGAVAEQVSGAITLQPGRYRVSAMAGSRTGRSEVEVTKDKPAKIVVALAGELPEASLQPAKTSVPATGLLDVQWSGPDGKGDYIALGRASGDPLETRQYTYTSEGNPLSIRIPGEPGEYELRYVSEELGAVLARAKIAVTPVAATLDAPAQASAGSAVTVKVAGPGAREDWVGLSKVGADPLGQPFDFAYVEGEEAVTLTLPPEPGAYEISYVSGLDPRVLAKRSITATAASAAIRAPERGMAGSPIKVAYTGKGSGNSFVGIAKRGAPAADALDWRTPDETQEAELRLPGVPGAYEIRFVLEAHGVSKVLAASPLIVDPPVATLTAPDRAERGGSVPVTFTGPGSATDYVTIVPVGSAPDAYETFRYTEAEEMPLALQAPEEPGDYELRYVMVTDDAGHVVLAKQPIRVD
ncbi:vWA domain-containing protein [Microvirga roseola]|uniref:vWA domain-containing protein n=1 Tax=Microvirga roseola TaxID=2883126 RepID=UPI001E59359E|nr:VWA domain-containing protein [Microvirga roseola]